MANERRRGESRAEYKERMRVAGRAEAATPTAKPKEDALVPWRKRYEEETGLSATGVSGKPKFNAWLRKKRAEALAKRKTKPKGPSMQDAGDALAEKDE